MSNKEDEISLIDMERERKRKVLIEKGRGKMQPGVFVRCVNDKGSFTPRLGELLVVVDGDRFPTKKRELIRKVGYDAYDFFVCVQSMESDICGFWAWPRFAVVQGGEG